MPHPALRLITEGFPDSPAMDTAVSHALLLRASAGAQPATLRVHRPADVVAFGPLDRLAPGFPAAVRFAAERGFAPVLRLAGGRAAVFHPRTIAFSWVVPDPDPRRGIRRRFEELSVIVAAALRDLGVDARVGEVPGEYCPGVHSVNARGRVKLMGVGQRLVHRAAHVGGVIVVGGADRVRDVLLPVYRALEVWWDPATVGSVEGEVGPVPWERAERALLDRFAERFDLEPGPVPPEVLEAARGLLPRHQLDAGIP